MVEEFMVCVDRMIAPSSSAAAASTVCSDSRCDNNNNSNSETGWLLSTAVSTSVQNNMEVLRTQNIEIGNGGNGNGNGSSEQKGCVLRECRICQEEDEEKDMEAPCDCNGTLKFAHRKCIQRWCNKKGDITCEICNQVFSPNYTSPPKQSNADVMAIDIRQAWGPNIDLQDPHFIAFAAAERQFLQSDYENYAVANNSTLGYFRSVVILVMLLLLIRHTLLVTRDYGMVRESSTFFHFQLSLLQLAGFLLPCYVMARSWYILQCRRRRQLAELIGKSIANQQVMTAADINITWHKTSSCC